jgi:ArsR family transcriptional regulator
MFVRFVVGTETENAFWLDGVIRVAGVLSEHGLPDRRRDALLGLKHSGRLLDLSSTSVYIDERRNKLAFVAIMTSKQFQHVARALADPQRLAILERIAQGRDELPCKTLVQEFSISQATISHHLKELSEAGLIDCRREAQCAFFSLRRPVMEEYRAELGRRMAPGS